MNVKEFISIDLNKKPNRRESAIFIAVLVLFSFAFVKSCIIPSQEALSKINQKIKESSAEKTNLLSVEKIVDSEQLGQKKWFGPKGAINFTTSELLRNFAQDEVTLFRSRLGTPEQVGPLRKQTVAAYVRGNFSNILKLIYFVEALPAPLVIEQFSIKRVSQEKSGKIELDLKGAIYEAF